MPLKDKSHQRRQVGDAVGGLFDHHAGTKQIKTYAELISAGSASLRADAASMPHLYLKRTKNNNNRKKTTKKKKSLQINTKTDTRTKTDTCMCAHASDNNSHTHHLLLLLLHRLRLNASYYSRLQIGKKVSKNKSRQRPN